jgi:hypothetical protein
MKLSLLVAAAALGLASCAQMPRSASSAQALFKPSMPVPFPEHTPYDSFPGARDAYLERFAEGYISTRTTGFLTSDCGEQEPYAEAKSKGYFAGQDAASITTVTVAFLNDLINKRPSIETIKRELGPDQGTVSIGEDEISYGFNIRIEGAERAVFLKSRSLPSVEKYSVYINYVHGVFTGFDIHPCLPFEEKDRPNKRTTDNCGAPPLRV